MTLVAPSLFAKTLDAVAPLFEGSNVVLPDESLPEGAEMDSFITNLTGFPFVAHDDDVDCCTQALNYLHQHGAYSGAFGEAMKKIREKQGMVSS